MWRQTFTLCIGFGLLSVPAWAGPEIPLHERVDALIQAASGGQPAAAPADDATFLRRAYLDFAAVIPDAATVRAFLADPAPDKRAKLIDQLLNAPEYAERMSEWFHIHFMERRGDDKVWLDWLKTAFAENRPWDRMAHQMIRADFRDEPNRGAAYFYSRRLEKYGQNVTDYAGLTRDVGRMFLGMDLQCAECHNHRLIDDYEQVDFQGLLAAFQNVKLLTAGYPAVEEGLLVKKLQFASVFTGKQRETGPRLPGMEEFALPAEGTWAVAPDKKAKTPGVPAFSPLAQFADGIATSPNFSANFVNRMWFKLMGRGIVEPLDLFHSENPPSHPELIQLLGKEFAARQFDVKWLLRELSLTRVYQRSSLLPDGVERSPEDRFLVAIERRLSAEQLLRSTLRATNNLPENVMMDDRKGATEDDKDVPGLRKRFQAALANEPKDPELGFSPTLKGALFAMNDTEVLKLPNAHGTSLVPRLAAMKDDAAVADELYLNTFSRLPSSQEREDIVADLRGFKGDRAKALEQLAWAMLSSTEFVVNH